MSKEDQYLALKTPLNPKQRDFGETARLIFDRLEIGVQEYHRVDLLTDVFMDDVRVSSHRIGCAR